MCWCHKIDKYQAWTYNRDHFDVNIKLLPNGCNLPSSNHQTVCKKTVRKKSHQAVAKPSEHLNAWIGLCVAQFYGKIFTKQSRHLHHRVLLSRHLLQPESHHSSLNKISSWVSGKGEMIIGVGKNRTQRNYVAKRLLAFCVFTFPLDCCLASQRPWWPIRTSCAG